MGNLSPWFDHLFRKGLEEFFTEMSELERVFQGGCIRSDYYETDKEVVVMVEIPGLSPRHRLDVRVEENILYIRGIVTHEGTEGERKKQVNTHFIMNVLLPARVDPTRMKTDLNQADRLLTVRLPKANA